MSLQEIKQTAKPNDWGQGFSIVFKIYIQSQNLGAWSWLFSSQDRERIASEWSKEEKCQVVEVAGLYTRPEHDKHDTGWSCPSLFPLPC